MSEISQNPNVKFIDYFEAPGQYQDGCAEIKYYGLIIRFLLKNKKDGTGKFVSAFSTKLNDKWYDGAECDSKILDRELKEFIMDGIRAKAIKQSQTTAESNWMLPKTQEVSTGSSTNSSAPIEDMPF